jgi:hypothetical protein
MNTVLMPASSREINFDAASPEMHTHTNVAQGRAAERGWGRPADSMEDPHLSQGGFRISHRHSDARLDFEGLLSAPQETGILLLRGQAAAQAPFTLGQRDPSTGLMMRQGLRDLTTHHRKYDLHVRNQRADFPANYGLGEFDKKDDHDNWASLYNWTADLSDKVHPHDPMMSQLSLGIINIQVKTVSERNKRTPIWSLRISKNNDGLRHHLNKAIWALSTSLLPGRCPQAHARFHGNYWDQAITIKNFPYVSGSYVAEKVLQTKVRLREQDQERHLQATRKVAARSVTPCDGNQ